MLSEQFRQYIDAIERLADGRTTVGPLEWWRKTMTCLEGEPAQELRRAAKYPWLRQQGAYFTGPGMASKLAGTLGLDPNSHQVYFDPTCGAGDLLLAIAKSLPIGTTLTSTLAEWGQCLAGYDISPDFVRLAKARLVLLAAKRCQVHPRDESVVLAHTFPKILEGNFLSRAQSAARIIMNPPFGYTTAPNGCPWAQGRVNAAAVFTEKAIRDSPEGAQIAAILPEVLRSGSRYQRWRSTIDSLGLIRAEYPLGLFNQWADVDVYLLDFLKVTERHRDPRPDDHQCTTHPLAVSQRFAVHVGPVVPHRHADTGSKVRYIYARSLPAWGECEDIVEHRGFNGRLFEPPFVAVRRTSRPDQGKRAVATLVLGQEPVAVENHLIVMLPKDHTVHACRELITRLRSSKTDDWINGRLRCRHLTTTVLADMPWWDQP